MVSVNYQKHASERAETLFLQRTTSQEFRRHHANIAVNYTCNYKYILLSEVDIYAHATLSLVRELRFNFSRRGLEQNFNSHPNYWKTVQYVAASEFRKI